MMTTKAMSAAVRNDAELVDASLAGNRDAFGQIVSRYQSLVCSLAYSATGSLSQSEDLAQETFVAAWKQLAGLREPEKLRAWLCGITRNLINNSLRRQGREPVHHAESLEEISESHSPEPQPLEQAISNEEAAILWRALERIPEIYREPLVLFYREHQSIEAVAQSLELTEDVVKQRLSRGRKMLHEQVLAFVEGALEKTSPGKNFTLGVLAALPMAAASAKAATVGAALAKGGAAAKGVMTVGSLGGLFAMIGGYCVSMKAQLDDSKSPRERQFMLRGMFSGKRWFLSLLLFAVFFAALKLGFFRVPIHRDFWAAAFAFFVCVYGMLTFDWHTRRRQQIQIEDNTYVEAEWTMPRKITDATADSVGAKSKDRFKVVRFMALSIVMAAWVLTRESWKQHWGHAVLMTTLFVLALFRFILAWRNRPRFQSLRSSWFVYFPVLMGLTTLFFFNRQQYLARAGSDVSHIVSPAEVFTFNLLVVLAYAVFIGILVWKRKSKPQAKPPN
ncbi:MAG: sigma-70 family RNA polymerase sigma factor [Verrucomicrobiota bacterium]